MSTDEQLRVGLPEAVDHLQPNVEAELGALRRRIRQRRRLRWSGLAAVAAAVMGMAGWLVPQWLTDAPLTPGTGPEPSLLDPNIGPLPPGSPGTVTPLRARTYVVRFDIFDYEDQPKAIVKVPEGWGRVTDFLLAGTGRGQSRWLGFWTAARVNTDPCTSWRVDEGWVDPGPGVGDLAQALINNAEGSVSRPKPVQVGGYSGVHLRLTSPPASAHCNGTALWESETGDRANRDAGTVDQLYILDVAGQRLLIDAIFPFNSRRGDVREVLQMAKGVTFTNVG